jgi:integrase
VNKCLLVVRQVLDVAVSRGKLPQNVLKVHKIKAIRERKSKPEAFTPDEVFVLAAHMPEHYSLATIFACYTGVRMSELVALQVGDLDFKNKLAHIERATVMVDNLPVTGLPKSHEVRDVPLIDLLVSRLSQQIKGRKKSDWLFPDPQGGQMVADKFRSAFKTRVKLIGRPGMTPHNCRDTAASLAISLGASVKTVSVFMGHSDASVTLRRYTAFFPKDYDTLRDALSKAVSTAERKTSKRVEQILAASVALDQAEAPF